MDSLICVMIALPLVGSILNGLILRTPYAKRAGVIATSFAAGSFVCAVILWTRLIATDTPITFATPWFKMGTYQLDWAFQFDWLTAVMALVVTGVGSLIHLYSIGYMSDDRTPYRYFAYLNLFLTMMLVLVTGASLPVLFVGWEGVGCCSYLLIGYWYQDPEKANAGMKAFLLNRIGDAGFLIGIFLCFELFQTVSFVEMSRGIANVGMAGGNLSKLNFAALCLFIGAMGKSAQIPLYVWLPDAMAGPTPVSALIHAATMVTAGIYMIIRMNFVFQIAPQTSAFIASIGAATALLAALIATSQRDIKKVLAYSTVSQLGLIFVALGTGAYVAALFHVVTHAFFKALLFLGAGSVIHAMGGEQDICKMGGLREKLPHTFWTFTIAWLAISGVPPLSGFFSKDLILYSVLGGQRGWVLWAVASFASLLTAFYMTRLYALTFLGKFRGPETTHPHESPPTMLIPLIVLAVGSALAGILELPHPLPFHGMLSHWLSPVVPSVEHAEAPIPEIAAILIATALAILGILVGLKLYVNPTAAEGPAQTVRPLQVIFQNKFWVDEFYDLVFVKPFEKVSAFLARFVDGRIIDAAFLLPSRLTRAGATLLSFVQWGSAQFYMLVMLLGGLAVLWLSLKGLVFT